VGRAPALEARVAGAEAETLHALPALDQREPRFDQVRVVGRTGRIEQMHRREVAFAALGSGDAALAADRDGARGKAFVGERAEHGIETDAVAAHDDEIWRARRLS